MRKYIAKLKDDLPSGIGKNSWYIQKPLEKCNGLFKNEKNEFIVHAFACKCGYTQIYINSLKHITHHCQMCSNNYFYTIANIADNSNTLLVNIELKPNLEKLKDGYKASFFLDVPIDIDINSTKLIYKKEKIYTIDISAQGEEKFYYKYTLSGYIKEYTEELFYKYIFNDIKKKLQNSNQLNFEQLKASEKKEIVSYFVKYPSLSDVSSYFWLRKSDTALVDWYCEQSTPYEALLTLANRKEKSIKRALFNFYTEKMNYKNFDPMMIVVICRIFEDSNIVCQLLEDTSISFGKQYTNYKTKYMLDLFKFLKLYYNKYELAKFIQEINTNFKLFEDIYNMYNFQTNSLASYFTKVKVSLKNIHDEFMIAGYRHYISSKYIFEYKDLYKDACIKTNTLEYKLPFTGEELSSWSIKLNNCLFSYAENIYKRHSIIYGVFKKKELVYALEIYNENIVQAVKHSNLPIQSKDMELITDWFQVYLKEKTPHATEINVQKLDPYIYHH